MFFKKQKFQLITCNFFANNPFCTKKSFSSLLSVIFFDFFVHFHFALIFFVRRLRANMRLKFTFKLTGLYAGPWPRSEKQIIPKNLFSIYGMVRKSSSKNSLFFDSIAALFKVKLIYNFLNGGVKVCIPF